MKKSFALRLGSWCPLTVVCFLIVRAGQAQFAPVSTYPIGNGTLPCSVALGDVNSDGRLDIVTANQGTNTIGLLLGQNGGGIAPVVSYTTGPISNPLAVAFGDSNGDGRLNLITANAANGTAGILLDQAGGGFAGPTTYATGTGSEPFGVAVGDVNGDSRLDIVLADFGGNSVRVLLSTAAPLATPAPVSLAPIRSAAPAFSPRCTTCPRSIMGAPG